jgi:hypothetical protein
MNMDLKLLKKYCRLLILECKGNGLVMVQIMCALNQREFFECCMEDGGTPTGDARRGAFPNRLSRNWRDCPREGMVLSVRLWLSAFPVFRVGLWGSDAGICGRDDAGGLFV